MRHVNGQPLPNVAAAPLRLRGICQMERYVLAHSCGVAGERIHSKICPLAAFQLGEGGTINPRQSLDITETQPLSLANLSQLREHLRSVPEFSQAGLRPPP